MVRSYNKALIKKILNSLREHGPLRKLKPSSYSLANFQACMKYVEFMNRLEWVNIATEINVKKKVTIIKIIEQECHVLELVSKEIKE